MMTYYKYDKWLDRKWDYTKFMVVVSIAFTIMGIIVYAMQGAIAVLVVAGTVWMVAVPFAVWCDKEIQKLP